MSEIVVRKVRPLKYWKHCGFCGRKRKYEGEPGWKFVPVLLDAPGGKKACPDCYPEQMDILTEAGVYIPLERCTMPDAPG